MEFWEVDSHKCRPIPAKGWFGRDVVDVSGSKDSLRQATNTLTRRWPQLQIKQVRTRRKARPRLPKCGVRGFVSFLELMFAAMQVIDRVRSDSLELELR